MPRRIVSEEEKKEWKKRYLLGETARSIAKDYPQWNESTISKNIKKMGISRGNHSFKLQNLNKESIKNDYLSGKYYCEELAKKYDVEVHNIYKILDEYQIKRNTGKHSSCNEEYFDIIDTPHKAYILGFIAADGGITGKYKSCLAIEVHQKDRKVLEFIVKEINTNATISNVKNKDNVKVSFNSKKMCETLVKYGIIPNKSKKMLPVPVELIPKNLLKFYFRGLIDGDGCVLKNGTLSIYSGTKSFIENVQSILCQEAGVSKLGIYKGTTYFVSWSSKSDRTKLYNYLYKDCLDNTFYYERKFKRLYDSLYANTEVTN